jgi:hypothetical protein
MRDPEAFVQTVRNPLQELIIELRLMLDDVCRASRLCRA